MLEVKETFQFLRYNDLRHFEIQYFEHINVKTIILISFKTEKDVLVPEKGNVFCEIYNYPIQTVFMYLR